MHDTFDAGTLEEMHQHASCQAGRQGSQQYRIKDIWLLRQLNAEEKSHRVGLLGLLLCPATSAPGWSWCIHSAYCCGSSCFSLPSLEQPMRNAAEFPTCAQLHDESSCKGEPLDAAALKQPRLQPSQQRTDAMRRAGQLRRHAGFVSLLLASPEARWQLHHMAVMQLSALRHGVQPVPACLPWPAGSCAHASCSLLQPCLDCCPHIACSRAVL